MVRFPDGIGGEFFFQKRAPKVRPPWVEVVTIRFPSGRSAEEIVPRDRAALAWMANLACLELHPHPVRADDLDHPDELRIDLDPVTGIAWSQVRDVARVVQETLADFNLCGWPKTSGKRGLHVLVRIERRWTHDVVRRAALALAREVERRVPELRDDQVVEGRAPRRVHRLQPERQGPHCRRRVLRASDTRRARVGAAPLERSGRSRSSRLHPRHDAERASRKIGDRHRDIDARHVFARQPERAFAAAGARRRRRRAMAASICEGARRAAARAALRVALGAKLRLRPRKPSSARKAS